MKERRIDIQLQYYFLLLEFISHYILNVEGKHLCFNFVRIDYLGGGGRTNYIYLIFYLSHFINIFRKPGMKYNVK